MRTLATSYNAALDALVDAWCGFDGLAYGSEEWRAAVVRIHELRLEVARLSDKLFRSVGYSVSTWTALKKRRG